MFNNIFVALDFSNFDDFIFHYNKVKNDFKCFKVGYELFFSHGVKVLNILNEDKKDIFLDLKFHDIGNTMKKAFKSLINRVKFDYLTVFLENNMEDLRELSHMANENGVKLLGVTLLTNMTEKDVSLLYENKSIKTVIQKRINFAHMVSFHGLILSPLDLSYLQIPKNLIKVTPGIRYENEVKDDQRRRVSPGRAFQMGADFLVMGRSIFKYGVERLIEELK